MGKISLSGPLQSVKWGPAPRWLSAGRLTRAQKAGIAFEKKFGRALQALDLGDVRHGHWIYYEDGAGSGVAQPDFVIVPPSGSIKLVECKLKYKDEADRKLSALYVPLLSHLMQRPVAPIQACRHLGVWGGAVGSIYELKDMLNDDSTEYRVIQYL